MIYGYLRVSTDTQDVDSQKIGVLKKAEELGFQIEEWITDEGISGAKDPNKRKLGALLQKIKDGDVIIISELSRFARTVFMLFDIVKHCMDVGCVIYSVKDSFNTFKSGDLVSMVLLFAFGLSAQIEREMIIKRTIEGLERRRRDGVLFGRPPGSKGKLKLDGKAELIQQYIDKKVPLRSICRILGVHRCTVEKFIKENENINYTPRPSVNAKYNQTKWHKLGIINKEMLLPYKDDIIGYIDEGKTIKDICNEMEKRGIKISATGMRNFITRNGLYEYLIAKNQELRKQRNKDCGKNKRIH
ncbi:MAG: recombinase family protein [Prevotellaceae bacterium]|jgi:DNA invertase Pin-like site-specific DNA recombinase|nr:recombinase family protein [Prevotellaceae bacterium]